MYVKYSFFCNEALINRQNAMISGNGESKVDVEKLDAKNEITCEELTEETINDILFKHKAKNYLYDYSIDYEILELFLFFLFFNVTLFFK